ncbi:MAG TPA: amino acid permease [Candidatus Binatia bacterium]|nr:amino acid permease [Candidatus Binatia bacterium]
MSDDKGSVRYTKVDDAYFEARGLRRHAGVGLLWALGVGAVISGQFSGWNLGFAFGGWGGMFVATVIITIMYLGLTYSLAEMSPAMPHTGGAYSFARTALGPWGGFLTGLAENVEYVLTPAVVVFFIGTYMGAILETPDSFQPVYWIAGYAIFVWLNFVGVEMSFRVTLIVTLAALACLAFFYAAAIPNIDFHRWALNIAADGSELPEGNGPFLPKGVAGILPCLPFAVWLYLAIEQLPLAAEESVDPRRDMPRGILLGMFTLAVSAILVLCLNPAIVGVGAHKLGTSAEPVLDGFKAIFGDEVAKLLSLVAVLGLVASFHSIIYAFGRQIYSLSRAGYFPTVLSLTHGTRKTPHVALLAGAVVGLSVMLVVWFTTGEEARGAFIGGTLLNMAVFGAMFSYIMQGVAFIRLRQRFPDMDRPYRSPFGVAGAALTVVIAAVTIYFQLQDAVFRAGVLGVAIWFAVCIAYFAAIGRHKLILSPEEEFALEHKKGARS